MIDKKISPSHIILIVLITLLIILLLALLFYMNITKTITINVKVTYVGADYIIVEDEETTEYLVNITDEYNVGDELMITLTNINDNVIPKEAEVTEVKVISRTVSFTITDNNSNIETSITNDTEEEIINFFNDLNNDIDANDSISDNIKSNFIKIIDFLFYGEEINGKTFDEISISTKLKILQIALDIDTKIEKKFPDYKDNLSNNYQNIKENIITEYLEITTNICEDNEDLCISAKEGLGEMKDNFNLTWSIIKDFAKEGSSNLKSWYEIWRQV